MDNPSSWTASPLLTGVLLAVVTTAGGYIAALHYAIFQAVRAHTKMLRNLRIEHEMLMQKFCKDEGMELGKLPTRVDSILNGHE